MNKPLKQLETRVVRTYKGGILLDKFLGKNFCEDTNCPEDWISSFIEAKNKDYIPGEGMTKVIYEGKEAFLCDCVDLNDYGQNRTSPKLLTKFLDAGERLGIQVHPTAEYADKFFGNAIGKTECWHILDTRTDGESACVYLGFKEWVTKDIWTDLFARQDIAGMLNALYRFDVKKGDTVLVRSGYPHAIGAGCFMLEIQEPCDYTMRTEKITVGGDELTPNQIHYGVGEENMLDCFDYTPRSRDEVYSSCFIAPVLTNENSNTITELVGYKDTPCFMLEQIDCTEYIFNKNMFTTIVSVGEGGHYEYEGKKYPLKKGDKYFISALCGDIVLRDCSVLVCYPDKV